MCRFLLLALLPVACGQEGEFLCPECDGGNADTADADTDTDTDSDTDADTDTDTGDSGITPPDGVYTGGIELVATSGDGRSDACAGSLHATIDRDAAPVIQGAGACSFAGTWTVLYPEGLEFTLQGGLGSPPSSSGTLSAEGESWSWSGEVDEGRFTGSFSGSLPGETTLTVNGSFETLR